MVEARASAPLPLRIDGGGTLNALTVHFSLTVDDENEYSSGLDGAPPTERRRAWDQSVRWLPDPLRVTAGQTVHVAARHDEHRLLALRVLPTGHRAEPEQS